MLFNDENEIYIQQEATVTTHVHIWYHVAILRCPSKLSLETYCSEVSVAVARWLAIASDIAPVSLVTLILIGRFKISPMSKAAEDLPCRNLPSLLMQLDFHSYRI